MHGEELNVIQHNYVLSETVSNNSDFYCDLNTIINPCINSITLPIMYANDLNARA